MLKQTTLLFVLLCSINIWGAENPFKVLPYKIVIGQTGNSEIERIGTCVKRIQVSDYYFRCAEYNLNDLLYVYSSQDETVSKVLLAGSPQLDGSNFYHKLPRKWRKAGLKWRMDANSFLNLIKNFDDIEEIEITRKRDKIIKITFYVDDHYFEVLTNTHYTTGLAVIEITEAY